MNFANVAVLCIGDVMLDKFVYGEVERISPEAPIPVLRMTGTSEMLGGAGNVANNIAALGGRALLVGLIGQDAAGDSVERLIVANPAMAGGLTRTARRPTICKTRFVAAQQQVVRADDESLAPLFEDEAADLLAAFERALPQAAAVILSDYGKGVLSEAVVRRLWRSPGRGGCRCSWIRRAATSRAMRARGASRRTRRSWRWRPGCRWAIRRRWRSRRGRR